MRTLDTIRKIKSGLPKAPGRFRYYWSKRWVRVVGGVLALGISYGAGHTTGQEGMAPEWTGVTVYEDGSVKVEPSEWAQKQRSDQWLCWSSESALKNTSSCG